MFCCCIVVRAGEIDVFVWVSFWLEELPIWWVFDQIKCLSYTFITDMKYNPKSEKVGTVWKTQIKKESSDF